MTEPAAGPQIVVETQPPAPAKTVTVEEKPAEPRKLSHAIFFTKEGALDLGWLILAICCLVGLVVFTAQSAGLTCSVFEGEVVCWPSREAWVWFGTFTALAFIAGAARDRATLIAKGTAVGAVAQGIGAVQERFPFRRRGDAEGFVPHQWRDGQETGLL